MKLFNLAPWEFQTIDSMFWLLFLGTIELSICLTIDNPWFFCECYGFISSLQAIAIQLLKCSWDWHEEIGMAIFQGANSRRILNAWIQVMPWNERQF